jgi:hypothetical protein
MVHSEKRGAEGIERGCRDVVGWCPVMTGDFLYQPHVQQKLLAFPWMANEP